MNGAITKFDSIENDKYTKSMQRTLYLYSQISRAVILQMPFPAPLQYAVFKKIFVKNFLKLLLVYQFFVGVTSERKGPRLGYRIAFRFKNSAV